MRKTLILLSLIITSSGLAWVAFDYDHSSILTEEDWEYMIEDNKLPAITLPETGEMYFNEWQCFSTKDVGTILVKIYYGENILSPTLTTSFGKRYVEYAIDPDKDWDENKVIEHWKYLLKISSSICIYSVYLQKNPEVELRYIERFKTQGGSWDRNDDRFLKDNMYITTISKTI